VVAGGAYRVVLLPVAWQSGSMVAAIHILVRTDVEKIRKDVASMYDMPNLPVDAVSFGSGDT
jgi:hypothetical protein